MKKFLKKTYIHYYIITFALIISIYLIEAPTFTRAIIYSPSMGWRLVILVVSLAFAFVIGIKNIAKMKWLYPVSVAMFIYLIPPAIDLTRRYPGSFAYYMMYNVVLGFPEFLIHLIVAIIGMGIGFGIWKSRQKGDCTRLPQ